MGGEGHHTFLIRKQTGFDPPIRYQAMGKAHTGKRTRRGEPTHCDLERFTVGWLSDLERRPR